MRTRTVCFGLIAVVALTATAPARAADFDKYLPENTALYVQINVPQLFSSQLVRKAVPMAFDKYGDQLAGLAGMAKGLPNVPDLPEDQIKDALKNMAKPESIAQAFDAATKLNAVTDIIVAMDPDDHTGKSLVILIKSKFVNAERAEMVVAFAGQVPQAKIESKKVEKGTIYTIKVPDQNQEGYATVPEPGLLLITLNEKHAEEALARVDSKAKPRLSAALVDQIAKRKANDFVFVAGRPNDPAKADHMETMVASVVLDKDLTVKMTGTFSSEDEAKKHAEKASEGIAMAIGQLEAALGDQGAELKVHLEKAKATVKGKNVEVDMTIPGTAVEKMLSKEK